MGGGYESKTCFDPFRITTVVRFGDEQILERLVALEPAQANLLDRIIAGPTIDADVLMGAGALSDSSAEAEAAGQDETEET